MMWNLLHRLFGHKTPTCKNVSEEFEAIHVNIGDCPNCGASHNDDEEPYWVNEVMYPKCFNERKGSTDWGDTHDWDELHCCEECKTKFWFENGIY